MRRRLATLVVATVSLVLVAFLIPLAMLVQTVAHDRAVSAATAEAHNLVPLVTNLGRPRLQAYLQARADTPHGAIPISVFLADGTVLGVRTPRSPAVELAQRDGSSITAETADGLEVLVSVDGDADLGEHAVVRAGVRGAQLRSGVTRSWLVLGLLGAGLLVIGVVVADRLARSLVRDISSLADVARTLGSGDLSARAAPSGPPELRDVGSALNALATQIRALIAAEREHVADLAHRARTPLTVLRIDAESLKDPEEAEQMSDNVSALERAVDQAIHDARLPEREPGASDAAAVVRDRVRFWSALAEEEHRAVHSDITPGRVPAGVSARDLEATVDALLGNVFAHTPEGAAFEVRLRVRPDGGAELTVADQGPGIADPAKVLQRGNSGGGSTGLGLDIARRTAELAGGCLSVTNRQEGGALIRLELGPPVRA